MSDTLMVGVSGIRGIVGKDLTEDIVARWARAFGTWARENGKREKGKGKRDAVVVGPGVRGRRDRRADLGRLRRDRRRSGTHAHGAARRRAPPRGRRDRDHGEP